MRIRMDLTYDGTDFSGWAKQPGQRTVQGELEAALGRILRSVQPVQVTVAGRTDAGVHARAQVVHVDLSRRAWQELPGRSNRSPEQALVHRVNALLPSDIAVRSAHQAPSGFDARFSAIWRRYSYRVIFAPDPLQRRYALVHEPLDIEAMNAAAAAVVGERDFAAFCKARPGATTIRTLQRFQWRALPSAQERGEQGPGGAVADLQADAFCHHMVRSLVGACVAVGSGKQDAQWLGEIAKSQQRSSQVHVAPAHGLTLEAVGYPDDSELAARAARARAVRTLPQPC